MKSKKSFFCAALLCLSVTPGVAVSQRQPIMERGRELTGLFYTQKLDSLWDQLAPQMQQVLGSKLGLRDFRQLVKSDMGDEVAVVSESAIGLSGNRVYARTSRFSKASAAILVQWSLGPAGRVTGFIVKPAGQEAPSTFLGYHTKTTLRLPFEGEWFVFWGGRTVAENYHSVAVDQRFAYDLLIVKNGSSHSGDGKRNEDYYCFGTPIFAPADGVVAEAVDAVDDNMPGVMNPTQAMGNHIVIDHGNGEFSFLAHFHRGSIKVKAGDHVRVGTLLGECGNSGNSSEPHLHYHLQNTGVPFRGSGLPAQFENYTADGKPVGRGEPVRGQTVRLML